MATTAKKLTKVQELERQVAILESALYMQYDDFDELHNLLACIIKSIEAEDYQNARTKSALKAFRSLLIAQQYQMMDCAGLEY